jgi:hypothetical protein
MTLEVVVEALLGVDAQKLADDLDGQHLRIGKLGLGATLAQLLPLEPIVGEAENGYDEGAKIHKGDPLYVWAAWNTTEHSGGLALFSTPQRNLHTGLARQPPFYPEKNQRESHQEAPPNTETMTAPTLRTPSR